MGTYTSPYMSGDEFDAYDADPVDFLPSGSAYRARTTETAQRAAKAVQTESLSRLSAFGGGTAYQASTGRVVDVRGGAIPLIGPAGAPGGVPAAAGVVSKLRGLLPGIAKVGLGVAGVKEVADVLGGGGLDISLPGQVDLPGGGGLLGLITRGGGGIPSELVAYTWNTGTAEFYRLIDGRIAVQRRNGMWKIYRPKKHIVISTNPRMSSVRKLERVHKRVIRDLARASGDLVLKSSRSTRRR